LGVAKKHRCAIFGGDISDAAELSISATAIGRVRRDRVLTRRGAKPGDTIFVSRPLGLTPAAFAYFQDRGRRTLRLNVPDVAVLARQFTSLAPMLSLGRRLGQSQACSSCMDNTDGISTSLHELAEASGVAFVVNRRSLVFPDVVQQIADTLRMDVVKLALSAGADFSLVGTLRGSWDSRLVRAKLGRSVTCIGRVETGQGLYLETGRQRVPLPATGWNYFSQTD